MLSKMLEFVQGATYARAALSVGLAIVSSGDSYPGLGVLFSKEFLWCYY